MLKKLTLLAMSAAALFALAAPAAQATGPLITNGLGEAATRIIGVSQNFVRHHPLGTFECTTAHLTIHLTENSNTTVKGHGTGTAFGDRTKQSHAVAPCNFANTIFEDISFAISDFHLTKHGTETTGTATLSYTYLWTNSGGGLTAECTYGGIVPIKVAGKFLTLNAEIAKTGGSAFCLAGLSFTSDFALTNEETGLPVEID